MRTNLFYLSFLILFVNCIKGNVYKSKLRSISANASFEATKNDGNNFKIQLPINNFLLNDNIKNIYSKDNTRNIYSKDNTRNIYSKDNTRNIYSKDNTKNRHSNNISNKSQSKDSEYFFESTSFFYFPSLLNAVYIFSSVCFILCLICLNSHDTSKRGATLGFIGILFAILITFTQVGIKFKYELFFLIISIAIFIGIYIANNVDMIHMPQLIALFHSFVGLASLFVGFSKFHSVYFETYEMSVTNLFEIYVGTFIATITFIGSLVAAGKLSNVLDSKSLQLKTKKILNISFIIMIIIAGYYFITSNSSYIKTICLYTSFVIECFLSLHLIASIGTADMPVIISVLNSYSGFSIVVSGFLLHNSLLIISGSLIGSSGAILSYIMCIGMNRDIINIVLGGWDDSEELTQSFSEISKTDKTLLQNDNKNEQYVNSTTIKYVAENLINVKNIIIVPGYGAAISKCQRELSEIFNILKSRNIKVHFAIHPVAGRMPGHLNVLLAEANIPYNVVKEMDEINQTLSSVDLALVVGANDIVNPSSFDTTSKIYGMPVIEVWKCKKVIVLKRSLNTGYSSIDNPLFYYPNTFILFGDAKYSCNKILSIINDYNTSNVYTNIVEDIQGREHDNTDDLSIMFAEKSSESDIMDNSFSIEDDEDKKGIDTEKKIKEEYPKARRVIGLIKDDDDDDDVEGESVVESGNVANDVDDYAARNVANDVDNYTARDVANDVDGYTARNVTNDVDDYVVENTETKINMTIVPITPKFIPNLKKMGFKVLVEKNIGKKILIKDKEYEKYGAEIVSRDTIFKHCNVILKVDPPTMNVINKISNNTTIISFLWPGINKKLLEDIIENQKDKKNITYLAIDEVPRSTRAQKLDVKTSMNNLKGYRAVLEAFFILPRFSKASITAAGKINPAKIFVIGAGVTGLQAIITAKSLGAIVYAYDSRLSAEEEVISCGGNFIKINNDELKNLDTQSKNTNKEYIKMQNNLFIKIIKKCDVLICTASIPGKKSPKLVTTQMIKSMKPGSVAVDLSTEFGDKENKWGGNIECSQPNKNIIINNVHVLGRNKIERNMPLQASDLFSMNIINLLEEMGGGTHFNVDLNNDIIKALTVIRDGVLLYSSINIIEKLEKSESIFVSKTSKGVLEPPVTKKITYYTTGSYLTKKFIDSDYYFYISLLCVIAFVLLAGITLSRPSLHYIFLAILSMFIGYYCVWAVSPSLHTPLMSVTNALSGIIIIGSMVEYSGDFNTLSSILSTIATFLSAINLSGGFCVTKRMIDMFAK